MSSSKQHNKKLELFPELCRMIEAFYFVIAITSCLVTGLQDVRVTVPKAARRGDSVVLHCHYDLKDDLLLAVKWYKDGSEFFRYTPEEKPPWTVLNVPDLQVDPVKSNGTQLYLTSVASSMSGDFSCEVLTDSFQQGAMAANMEVVEVPQLAPVLTLLDSKLYRSRDTLMAKCTSSPSRPAVNLTWGLNGENVNPKWLKQYRRVTDTHSDLEESLSVLEVTLKSYHVTSGSLKVRCTASLYDLYWQTTEAVVITDKEGASADKSGWDDYYEEYDFENHFGEKELANTSAASCPTLSPDAAFNNMALLGLPVLYTALSVITSYRLVL